MKTLKPNQLLFKAASNKKEVAHTWLKYNMRKLPRKLISDISEKHITNQHSCGLFLFCWLLCNVRSRYTQKEAEYEDIEECPSIMLSLTKLESLINVKSAASTKQQLQNLADKGLITYQKEKQYCPKQKRIQTYYKITLLKKKTAITTPRKVQYEKDTIENHNGFIFYSLFDEFRQTFYGENFSCADFMILLHLNAIYQDINFPFSAHAALVVWFNSKLYPIKPCRKEMQSHHFCWCSPLTEIASRIHVTAPTVKSYLKELQNAGMITAYHFPARGTVIYINQYAKNTYPKTFLIKKVQDNIPTIEIIKQKLFGIDPNVKCEKLVKKIRAQSYIIQQNKNKKQNIIDIINQQKKLGEQDTLYYTKKIDCISKQIRYTEYRQTQNERQYLHLKGIAIEDDISNYSQKHSQYIERLFFDTFNKIRSKIKAGFYLPESEWNQHAQNPYCCQN